MFKSLKKYQIQLAPFQASKDWAINNVDNNDVLLTEADEEIALEFLDYNSGSTPVVNSLCDIALEQQDDDRASYKEGLKLTGPFYPDVDPTNPDGTYKRVIYYQVRTMFYNQIRDVTKLWGVENVDFENSKNKRRITDLLRMFEIPRVVFGDKITPNTLEIFDESLDNNFIITDDGNGNLLAGTNLFSKQQEIGDFENEFITGSDSTCNGYFNFLAPDPPSALTASSGSAILTWTDNSNNEDGFVIEKSINSGSTWLSLHTTPPNTITYTDTNVTTSILYSYRVYAFNSIGTSSFSNTASIFFSSSSPVTVSCISQTGSIRFDGHNIGWINTFPNLLVASDENIQEIYFVNTNTDTIQSSASLFWSTNGAYATHNNTASVYLINANTNNTIQVFTTGGFHYDTITNISSMYSVVSASGYLWSAVYGTTNFTISRIDPATHTITQFSATASDTAGPLLHAVDDSTNSIHQLYAYATEGVRIRVYTLPAVSHSFEISFVSQGSYDTGFAYAQNIGKVLLATFNSSSSNPEVWEFNPVTFTTDYIYDLTNIVTNNGFSSISSIAYNPISGMFYLNDSIWIYVYNPTLRTFVCSASVDPNNQAVFPYVEPVSGKIYDVISIDPVTPPFNSSSISIFR